LGARLIPVEPFDLVIFGGTGDLAMRKLLPGLYQRDRDRQLPAEGRIIAVARPGLDRDGFVAEAEAALRRFVDPGRLAAEDLARFLGRLDYLGLDLRGGDGWPGLAARLAEAPDRVRVFYLATSPDLFGPVCARLAGAGAVTPEARVVLEKPIGRDLGSARAINAAVGAVFAERRIFRIDHYLGKETVQNLMALRFANSLFEPVWNRAHVDHVQITVGETVGVEGRAPYYDRSGALRDMVQNHLLQLLCLVAMEPPAELTADGVRDEKLKVLKALGPIADGGVAGRTVRGQYRAGAIAGEAVPGYLQELGGANDSRTETFVALKAEVGNWRWAGVPFYLRTGKRLAARVSEIVVQFRQLPHSVFGRDAGEIRPNRLVIRLQPDEGVRLHMMSKDPGPGGMRLKQVPLDLSFAEAFPDRHPDAYERLLLDVVRGDPTLFMRKDEVEAAWAWVDPIVAGWDEDEDGAPHPYLAGSWGPSQAVALIARDGRTWLDAA
jgi:glucose-6-phosphate 1-dehydrogenase